MIRIPTKKKELAKKLVHQLFGPYKVLEKISNQSFKLKIPNSEKHSIVHPDRMKQYLDYRKIFQHDNEVTKKKNDQEEINKRKDEPLSKNSPS